MLCWSAFPAVGVACSLVIRSIYSKIRALVGSLISCANLVFYLLSWVLLLMRLRCSPVAQTFKDAVDHVQRPPQNLVEGLVVEDVEGDLHHEALSQITLTPTASNPCDLAVLTLFFLFLGHWPHRPSSICLLFSSSRAVTRKSFLFSLLTTFFWLAFLHFFEIARHPSCLA